MWVISTFFIGTVGGLVFYRLKIPSGILIGAILFAAALNLFTGQAYVWPEARVFAQILTGIHIACMSDEGFIKRLPQLVKPALLIFAAFLCLNFVLGWIVYFLTDLDLLTSLLCAMPGGVSDTPLIAMDMGADASIVAAMQMVRMLFGICCLPYMIYQYDRKANPSSPPIERGSRSLRIGRGAVPLYPFLPMLLAAAIAGLIGQRSAIPAGAMSASLIVTLAFKQFVSTAQMPQWLWLIARIIIGCSIGASIGIGQIMRLRQMILPSVILCITYMLCSFMFGRLMHRLFHTPLREAMLTFSPAGAAEMVMISADLGIHSTDLIILQIYRLMCVVLLFPQIFAIVIH